MKLRGVTNGRVDSYLTSLLLVQTGKMEILSDGSTVKIADVPNTLENRRALRELATYHAVSAYGYSPSGICVTTPFSASESVLLHGYRDDGLRDEAINHMLSRAFKSFTPLDADEGAGNAPENMRAELGGFSFEPRIQHNSDYQPEILVDIFGPAPKDCHNATTGIATDSGYINTVTLGVPDDFTGRGGFDKFREAIYNVAADFTLKHFQVMRKEHEVLDLDAMFGEGKLDRVFVQNNPWYDVAEIGEFLSPADV